MVVVRFLFEVCCLYVRNYTAINGFFFGTIGTIVAHKFPLYVDNAVAFLHFHKGGRLELLLHLHQHILHATDLSMKILYLIYKI